MVVQFLWSSHSFLGLKTLNIIDKKSHQNGRILVDVKLKEDKFLPVNLCNYNIESEQIKTLVTLNYLLEDIQKISDKKVIIGGDLNLVFDCSLEACLGNPV